MRARLLLNQGLVQEAQMEPNEGINLIKSAIEICSKYKLSEDLHRAHLSLGALHERQGNNELALEHFDLAAKTDDASMKANALLTKSELFLKNGEWTKARKILVTLYPVKTLPRATQKQLEKLLRIAVTLCKCEEKLNSKNTDINRFKLYEDLGDAAAAARCYNKALEYYKEMLFHAEKDELDEGIAAALVSLAQTFKDAGRYNEALTFARRELKMCTDPREAYRSALFLADLLESAGSTSSEIIESYKLALSKAEISEDPSLEVTALKEYHHYLESQKSEDAEIVKTRLDLLMDTIPELDSEKEIIDSPDIGADIYLDELSDLEQTEEDKNKNKPSRLKSTRRRGSAIRRNEKGETQLHVACIDGSIEKVEKLIEDGHSPNVRDNCGWTPLHEAANHGFVDIARLLINAGANINDPGGPACKGVTPLHDAASCGNFSVMNLLIDKGADIYAITKDGDSTLDSLEGWRNRVQNLSDSDESEYRYVRNKLCMKGVPRKKANNAVDKPSPNRSRNRIEFSDEEEDEHFEQANISAGEDYKRTIAVLRDRGARLPPLSKSSTSPKELAPLLDSEQVLVDEWLDDDIGINTVKKKNSFNDPLSTAKRKSGGSTPAGERLNKRQRIRMDDGVSEPMNICDREEESCDSSCNEISEVTGEPERIARRKRQSSLLSIGFSRFSVSRTPSPIFTVSQKNESAPQTQTEEVNLSVLIEEKLFKLRLTVKEEQRITAESIVREVQRKFQEDTGCVPQFDLVGPNGDTISPQDTIDALLPSGNSTTLNSKLRKMDVPPISDRYRKICSTWNVGIEEGTMKCLKTCENTSIFRLRGREISDPEIPPLLKSLEYQIRLQVLHLSGGSFNDVGETLSRCLEQLTSLQELHLRCCDMDSTCLSKVDKFPLQIRVLDLSYNPLGKEAMYRLHELLSPLKNLQTLNLSNCEMENFIQGTSSPALTNLDLSWNPLAEEGLRCLLQPHMLSLNASGSIGRNQSCLIAPALLSHPEFSLATLESLELSSCDLSDSDLSRILSQTSNLTRLVANGNPKLTKQSLLKILQHRPTLSYVDISGCSEISEPPDVGADISSPDICTLVISMAFEVQQSWLELWCGEGSIQILPHNVVIFKHR